MKNSGKEMIERFENLLKFIHKNNWKTGLYRDLLHQK